MPILIIGGNRFILSQDEMPTLPDLITLLADLLGAKPRILTVPVETIPEAGLELRDVSPFSSHWMSCLDPTRAKSE